MKPLPLGCVVRCLRPADETALLEFFNSHTRETIFQRYHYFVAEMTHRRAMSLLTVDQQRDVALAVVQTGEVERIHAIARYYTEPSGQIAEMAFVVRESMRHRGLATRLLHELGERAHQHGLRWLRAQILNDNYAMQGLLRPYVSQIHPMPCSDIIEHLVPVSALGTSHHHGAQTVHD